MPSLQLAEYLQLRADGETVEAAAEQSGIGLAEARLHEVDIASGDLPLPPPRVRAPAHTREAEPRKENAMVTVAGDELRLLIERVEMQAALELPIPLAGVSLTVFGAPVSKGRPRVFMQAGRAIATTPPKTRRYEDLLRMEAGRVMEGRAQLEGPLSVKIRAYVQMPQSLAKHKIKGPSAERGVIRPLTRPDIDNYAKGPLDALNGIVWRDDSQVVELTVEKFYSSRPRLELTASEL